MKELESYADLLEYLKTLTPEQLKQKPQYAPSSAIASEILTMKPCIAIGTMDEFEFFAARSSTNNKFNADEIVFLTDGNPFAEDGATSYLVNPKDSDKEMKKLKKEMKKNPFRAIKKFKMGKPCYGPDGPTKLKDQLNPKNPSTFGVGESIIINHRCKD